MLLKSAAYNVPICCTASVNFHLSCRVTSVSIAAVIRAKCELRYSQFHTAETYFCVFETPLVVAVLLVWEFAWKVYFDLVCFTSAISLNMRVLFVNCRRRTHFCSRYFVNLADVQYRSAHVKT